MQSETKKFLAWKWCEVENKHKPVDKEKCKKLYEEYRDIIAKKNKN